MGDIDGSSGSQQGLFLFPLVELSPVRVDKVLGYVFRGSAMSSGLPHPYLRTTYRRRGVASIIRWNCVLVHCRRT